MSCAKVIQTRVDSRKVQPKRTCPGNHHLSREEDRPGQWVEWQMYPGPSRCGVSLVPCEAGGAAKERSDGRRIYERGDGGPAWHRHQRRVWGREVAERRTWLSRTCLDARALALSSPPAVRTPLPLPPLSRPPAVRHLSILPLPAALSAPCMHPLLVHIHSTLRCHSSSALRPSLRP